MRDIPSGFGEYQFTGSKEPQVVVEIAFDAAATDLVYLTSHATTPLPSGAVAVLNSVVKVSSTSQTIAPDEGRSTIGTISVDVLDKAGAFSTLLRARDDAGRGLRYKRVRVYQGFAGMSWATLSTNLIQTQIVDDLRYGEGKYTIVCADVQRSARKEIFLRQKTTLSASMTESQMLVPVWSVTGFQRVAHGSTYSDAPNQEVGYLKIDDEVIRWTGTTTDGTLGLCFVVGQRGALGTKAAEHLVDASTSSDQTTEVEEFVYLELPAVKLAYAILTGDLYGQAGKTLPDGWHLNIPGAYVRAADFINIGPDLWNPSTDDGFVIRFAGEDKQDGKQFIEEQLCLLLACFMPIYSNGELGLRRFTSVLHNAPHVWEINDSNAVKYGDLSIDIRSVFNVLSIEWNYDHLQDKLTRQKILIDQESLDKYDATPTKSMQFRGLHGSRHTKTTVEGLFDRLRDRYAAPPQKITIRCLPQLNFLEVGDIVRVRTSGVRDYFGSVTSIDRAFEIQRVQVDWVTGQVDLQLFGSTQPAGAIAPENPGNGNPDAGGSVLPNGWYTGSGTNITALGAAVTTSITGGVRHITGGAGIVGSDSVGGTRIYCDGDLELDAGVVLPFTKNVMLVVRGHLQINGTLDGRARGHAGAAALSGIYANIDNHNAGVSGYIGPTISGGGIYFIGSGTERGTLRSDPGFTTQGQVAIPPRLNLDYVGGQLIGIPANLQGTSGSTGRGADTESSNSSAHEIYPGGAGGAGGAGLVIVARGVSFGAAGAIKTSGGDAEQKAAVAASVTHNGFFLRPGVGAAGAPGAIYFLIDGIDNEIPGLAGVEALYGDPNFPTADTVLTAPQKKWEQVDDGDTVYSHYIGFGNTQINLSGYNGAARIQYIPPINAPVEDVPAMAQRPLSVSLTALPNTPRTPAGDRTSIEVTVTPPSDANYHHSNIYYSKDGGPLVYSGAAGGEWVFVVPSDGANYEVRAYAVSVSDVESTDFASAQITLSNTQAAALPTVTGLALEQAFYGSSAKIKWDAVDGAETYAVGVYAGSPTQTLRRTVNVGNALRFEYSYEDAIADGGPWRDIQFQVRGLNPSRTSGSWAIVNASNPQMGAPTGVQIGSIARTFTISCARPTATDYLATRFVMSATAGFTPGAVTPFYDGPETSATVTNVSPGTYYVRAAHYDTFGSDSLTWSAEFSIAIIDTTAAGGVPTVANASTLTTLADAQHWAVLSLHDNHIWVWDSVNEDGYLNTADGANLVANSIGANRLAVLELSAISADLGDVTAGRFSTDPGTGFRVEIEGGHSMPFWLGSGSKTAGNARLYIDTAGNLVADGLIIEAGYGYGALGDRPTTLAGVNATEGAKLAGISPYADNSLVTAGQSNLILDDGFYSPGWWQNNFALTTWPTGFSAASGIGTSDQPLRYLLIDSTSADPFSNSSTRWVVTPGKQYRIRLKMYLSPDFAGYIAPIVHVPNVAWALPGNTTPIVGGSLAGLPSHTAATWGVGAWATADAVHTTASGYGYMEVVLGGQITAGYCAIYMEVLPFSTSDDLQYGVTITAGGINMNSGGALWGGTSNPNAGAGVYLGWYSGAYHLLAGNYSSEKYLHFDGVNLILGKKTKIEGVPTVYDDDLYVHERGSIDSADYLTQSSGTGTYTTGFGWQLSLGGSASLTGAAQVTYSGFYGFSPPRLMGSPSWSGKLVLRGIVGFGSSGSIYPGTRLVYGLGQFQTLDSIDEVTQRVCFTVHDGRYFYATVANGSAVSHTLIYDRGSNLSFESVTLQIEIESGVARFYVDGALRGTISSGLPTGTTYSERVMSAKFFRTGASISGCNVIVGEWKFMRKA